ncbi:hypothetical protein N658DRAFT_304394 [Parathielavia hyrcaniae]|uniref:Uncharacterized protein n=1 Tax=Parathielavia hyrcaniae TaxID=113614 RepID=A0AAN6Q422_9PEZI|nr:hypothetical protein N658DRAFT_304394 [Parathielavia hyrcaniae]
MSDPDVIRFRLATHTLRERTVKRGGDPPISGPPLLGAAGPRRVRRHGVAGVVVVFYCSSSRVLQDDICRKAEKAEVGRSKLKVETREVNLVCMPDYGT